MYWMLAHMSQLWSSKAVKESDAVMVAAHASLSDFLQQDNESTKDFELVMCSE